MASRLAAALLLLGVICTGFAGAEVVVDCCLSTTDKIFPLIRIESYVLQEAGNGCDISATVFITKNEKTLCIIHPKDSNKKTKWVKSHIEHLNNRRPQK
ncbi:C-C motif chemokine 20-like [Paralichthys olivaceus]|uniref:C-C motif chemokine 20-like n=1 Tax=Paralichthys olivaceus TaxID=8255 RepID=UPI003752CF0D